MKRIFLAFSVLALSGILILSCKKPKPNVAPEPDTEVASAIDVAWATSLITDIDMQCGFMGEDAGLNHFYTDVPGTKFTGTNTATQGSMTITRQLDPSNLIAMTFNKTSCIDGRYRDGSIIMQYGPNPLLFTNPVQVPGNIYTKDYSFGGAVTLSEYKVDGWLITTIGGEPALLRNTLSSATYDPNLVNLTWSLSGKFKMQHPTDTNQNIVWIGTLKKTLNSKGNPRVFKATAKHDKDSLINWTKGIVSYEVNATGFTSRTIPFSIEVTSANPLVRDFACYPDKIAAVATTGSVGVLSQRVDTYHPISKGIMSFTTGAQYPRQIYFGNEGSPSLAEQCDNTGEVLIKGNTYRINFRK